MTTSPDAASWSRAAPASSGAHVVARARQPRAADGVRARAAPTTTCATATGVDAALRGRPARDRHPPRRRRRRDRRQPREPGPVLLRERDHGHRAHGAGAPGRRRRSSSRSGPSARIRSSRRCRSARTTSGTATPRRRTPRTASRRRCCWSRARRTASSTASTSSTCIPVNLYGPGDNFDPASVARHPGADQEVRRRERGAATTTSTCGAPAAPRASSCTSRTPPTGSCSRPSATTAPSRSTSASASEITIRELVELIARLTGFEGEIRWDATEAGRPAAPRARHEPRARALRLRGDDVVRGRPARARSTGTQADRRTRVRHVDASDSPGSAWR